MFACSPHEDPIKDSTDLRARYADEVVAAVSLTPAQQAAQDVIERQDYATMLRDTVPTLKADHAGAVYLLAVLDQAGDAHVKRRQFLKAAGKVTGGHPPFMELALIQIQASKGAR